RRRFKYTRACLSNQGGCRLSGRISIRYVKTRWNTEKVDGCEQATSVGMAPHHSFKIGYSAGIRRLYGKIGLRGFNSLIGFTIRRNAIIDVFSYDALATLHRSDKIG